MGIIIFVIIKMKNFVILALLGYITAVQINQPF